MTIRFALIFPLTGCGQYCPLFLIIDSCRNAYPARMGNSRIASPRQRVSIRFRDVRASGAFSLVPSLSSSLSRPPSFHSPLFLSVHPSISLSLPLPPLSLSLPLSLFLPFSHPSPFPLLSRPPLSFLSISLYFLLHITNKTEICVNNVNRKSKGNLHWRKMQNKFVPICQSCVKLPHH